MASPNVIVATGEPRGLFQEATLKTAAAKPGQSVKLTGLSGVATDAFAGGCTVREYEVAPGFAGEVCVLIEKNLVGQTISDEHAVDDGVQYYIPLPGEPFYALGLSGETLNVGTRGSFNAAGKLIADVDGPVICMDAGGALAADTLLLCRVGHTDTVTAS